MSSIENIFDEFAEEYLEETNERNIVIIASSKIDDYLFVILNNYLLPKIEGIKSKNRMVFISMNRRFPFVDLHFERCVSRNFT